ncbi:hypothetical protein N7530_007343 [Penicillium desertorum]|uniref:Uncharacterized protein n=1 Tax=Penicillium desertorum TaxID=1303715 RepID=A0A9X0BJU7_9EURO|nr:hypothetical protein N7530_007343 [Penicillium desertorum]
MSVLHILGQIFALAFAAQSIEISLDSTSKAVSTLDLMPLTSILIAILGAVHLDTIYVLEPMYNFFSISCFLIGNRNDRLW